MDEALGRMGSARPVALSRPPLEQVAAQAARSWLAALVGGRPLDAVADLPLAALAEEAQALCEAVLGAIESDAELEHLAAPSGKRLPAAHAIELAGDEPADVVSTVECLRESLLAALGATRPADDPVSLSAAGDRLAHVCAALAAGCLAPAEAGSVRGAEFDPLAQLASAVQEAAEPVRPQREPRLRRVEPPDGGDEQPDRPLRPPDPLPTPTDPTRPLWMAALDRQLAEGGRSGRRFALLLIELSDADRLRSVSAGDGAEEVMAVVGRAIRERVRRADLLAHEDDGRIWVIAPDAGRTGGFALASRLARAVERSGRLRGAPLKASIGLAVFPDDGREAASLTEQAEEQMFAARASGLPLAHGGSEEPISDGA